MHSQKSQGAIEREFTPKGHKLLCFLSKLAGIASWLAFTDWGEKFHALSVDCLEEDIHNQWLGGYAPLIDSLSKELQPDSGPRIERVLPRVEMLDLLAVTTAMTIGRLENERSYADSLAVHFRGVIVADMIACRQRLDLDACFIRFIPGFIQANGEKREKIYTKAEFRKDKSPLFDLAPELATNPSDEISNMEIIPRAELSDVTIFIYLDILVDNKLLQTDCPLPTQLECLGKSLCDD